MEEGVEQNNNLEEARKQVDEILNKYIRENYSSKKREMSYHQRVTKEQVEEELKYEYLDNFWLKLPMVKNEDSENESLLTYQYKITGGWDKTYRQWLEEKGISTDKYSDKLLNSTGEEFVRDIDQAVEDTIQSGEISREKLQGLAETQKSRELDLYAFPIFTRLYAMGYDHYKDLTE